MKRIVLFAVCAIAATAAAAEWHYLSGGKLSGISSVGSYVWAVGQDGLFFHSIDNGETWRRVPRFTTRNLVDVEFWDQGFGLITAEGDMLYRTTDNGGTWDSTYVQYIGGRIRFITRNCIWVTGGRTFRSTDGGLTWGARTGRWYLDSLNGWANHATDVVRTTDAGQHWGAVGKVVVPYSSGDIRCFGFNGEETGICAWTSSMYVGREQVFAYGWSVSSDGGSTWDYLTESATDGVSCDISSDGSVYGAEEHGCVVHGPSGFRRTGTSSFQEFRDISAARGDRVWVCGDGGAIWSSSDSGASWMPSHPQSGIRFVNVDFSDSLHGWGVTYDWAARTTDAGRSWIQAAAKFGVFPISDVVALDESTCVTAAGWSYFDVYSGYEGNFGLGRTTNAGASWDTIHFVQFSSGGAAIGSSRFSHVGRRIWHPGNRSPDGNSLRSMDGGMTWLDMDTLGLVGNNEPADISFVDTMNGWVVDSRQNVHSTSDGGDSWTTIATGLVVKRLKMTSLTTGWAISDSELFKTTDGGVNWQSVLAESGLQAIAFCDSLHGAIVGLNGLILRTSDAGQIWLRDSSDFTSDLYDVCMLDSTHAWAVGANGLVLGFGDWAIGVDEGGGQVVSRARTASISVQPNPSRGRATVELSHPLAIPTRMTLVDVSGRVSLAVPVRAGVRFLNLDLRGMPSGVYFVRAGAGPAARLVVQR